LAGKIQGLEEEGAAMSRENKAGVLVTCCFLCLVGAVIGIKMREPAGTQGPDTAPVEVAANQATPPALNIDPHPKTPDTTSARSGLTPPSTKPASPATSALSGLDRAKPPAAKPDAGLLFPPDTKKAATGDTVKKDGAPPAPAGLFDLPDVDMTTKPKPPTSATAPVARPPAPKPADSLFPDLPPPGDSGAGGKKPSASGLLSGDLPPPPPSTEKKKTAAGARPLPGDLPPPLPGEAALPPPPAGSGGLGSGADKSLPGGTDRKSDHTDLAGSAAKTSTAPTVKIGSVDALPPPPAATDKPAATGIGGLPPPPPPPIGDAAADRKTIVPPSPSEVGIGPPPVRPAPAADPTPKPSTDSQFTPGRSSERVAPTPITPPATDPAPAAGRGGSVGLGTPVPAGDVPAPRESTRSTPPSVIPAALDPSTAGSGPVRGSPPVVPVRMTDVEERISPTPAPVTTPPLQYSPTPVASGGAASLPAVREPARPAVPRPAGSVTVHAYTEYTCQAGDTLQSISQRAYGSERYANALSNYNRRDAAPNTLSESGDIKAGGVIFLPDKRHLEDAYGALIDR
jgi:hypothetical protein